MRISRRSLWSDLSLQLIVGRLVLPARKTMTNQTRPKLYNIYWQFRQVIRASLPYQFRQRLKAYGRHSLETSREVADQVDQFSGVMLDKGIRLSRGSGWCWNSLRDYATYRYEPRLFVTIDLDNTKTPPVVSTQAQHVTALIRLHGAPMGQIYLGKGPQSWTFENIRTIALHGFYLQLNVWKHLEKDGLYHDVTRLEEGIIPACVYRQFERPFEDWPLVSIIIPTHNRTESLNRLLKSLQALSYPGPKEIIVVDNKPDDRRTEELIATFKEVTYLCENELIGVSAARNTGLQYAKGEIIVFTDDDTHVEPQWLTAIMETFLANPEVKAVTGPAYPVELETEAQVLFESHASFNHGEWQRVFTMTEPIEGKYLPGGVSWVGAGCNMSFRRKTLDEVGTFDLVLDRQTPARTGGDNDLLYRLLRAGHKLIYEPKAMLYHHHRRELSQLKAQLRHYGRGRTAFATKIAMTDPLMRARALRFILGWIAWSQPALWLSGKMPRELVWAEWSQNFLGVPGYLLARWQNRRK